MVLKFSKYHGNGNDFIIIDNRRQIFPDNSQALINRLCNRNFGVGADGLMLLEESGDFDFHMIYFNSDGREGSMCGNGGRCIVHFARELAIVKDTAIFSGIDGIHEASFDDRGLVHLKMQDVDKIEKDGMAFILDTGSPHYVIFADSIAGMDVVKAGRMIRFSDRYKENGINVNFVQRASDHILIRTYERGVENETLACGTGSVAAALASVIDSPSKGESIKTETRGGMLEVRFRRTGRLSFSDIWLTGPAKHVFEGIVDTDDIAG